MSPDNKKLLNIEQLKYQAVIKPQSKTIPEEFIDQHMSLVHAIANIFLKKHKLPTGIEENDLVSWGIEGLIKARKNFKENKGSKFSTYAYYRIKGEIFDRIREEWSYRNPISYQEQRRNIQNKIADLVENALEAGEELDNTRLGEYVQRVISSTAMSYIISLDAIQEYHEGEIVGEMPMSQDDVPSDAVWEAVQQLSPEEQQIVKLFYVEDLKQKEIAKKLNFSNSKICRIHLKILEKLKRRLKEAV